MLALAAGAAAVAQEPTLDNAGYGCFYHDIELDPETGNSLHLGIAVAASTGRTYVSATGLGGVPPHLIYEFDQVGRFLGVSQQPAIQQESSFGVRDMAHDGQSLIGGIVVLLGGDFDGLNRLYETVYEAHEESWTLTMVPINSTLRSMIREIRVAGLGQTITQIKTLETNGDVTTTQLTNIETGVPITEVEQAAFSTTPAPRK